MDAATVMNQLVEDGYLEVSADGNGTAVTNKGALFLAFCMDTMTVGDMAAFASAAVSGGELPWRIQAVMTPKRDALPWQQGGA